VAQESRTNRFVQLDRTLAVVPNAAADLTVKDTWLEQVVVANITGTAATFTLKDKQSTPRSLLVISVPANDTKIYTFPSPVKMPGGVNWVAGTSAALNASIVGYRLP
jgi:hypothetical protein